MSTAHDESSSTEQTARRAIWRNRDFLLLWSGQAISDIGASVSELAFPLLVLAITGSAVQTGIIAALRSLPALIFSLHAGALVDRWDRKRVMIICDIGRLLSLASVPLAFAINHLSIYQLYICALLEGTLAVLFNLAHSASLGQVVAKDQLPSAFALDEFTEGTTTLAGPSISGLLFTLGQILPFIADTISYGVSLVTLLLIRTPFQQKREAARQHLLVEIREGIAWVWKQPVIRSMTLLGIPAYFAMSGSSLAVIVLAQERHASPIVIGLIFALGGIGSILGSLMMPWLEKRLSVGQSILLCRWIFALFWPLYILIPVPLLMGLVEFAMGFADPIEDVPYFSYRLSLIPEALRGRVISACRLLSGATRPLGLFVTGICLQRFGAIVTLFISWLFVLGIAVLMSCNQHIRQARRS